VAYAERQGWQIAEVYEDVMSGAKSSRPGLNRLMEDAGARKFDCVLVWKLDRFGRSLVDCLNNIRTLEENGVRFIAVTQGLDTDQGTVERSSQSQRATSEARIVPHHRR